MVTEREFRAGSVVAAHHDIVPLQSLPRHDDASVHSPSLPFPSLSMSIADASILQLPRPVPTWQDAEDPRNPHNWSRRTKWICTFVVSGLSVIPPMSSSIVAPALSTISHDFKITNSVEQQLVLSSYVLACGIGPLWLGPLSEVYGRVILLQMSNLGSLIFNVACGLSKSKAQLITFRFLGGLLGTASLAV